MRTRTKRPASHTRRNDADQANKTAEVVSLWGKRDIPTAGKDIDNIGQLARSIGFSHEEAEAIERLYRPTLKTKLK